MTRAISACYPTQIYSKRGFFVYEIFNDSNRSTLVVTEHRRRTPAESGGYPVRLCEFRKLNGKILKTVDAVYQDVTTLDECRQKCLSVNYRCQSFDYGDPSQHVCRLSHHSVSTLTHIQDPYLDIPGVTTYEIAACYNVTIQCKAREMIAKVKTSKVFNGRIYAKSRPNSCVADVANSVDFEIKMAYHDLNCDVKQENFGEFSNDIVIQHHDMIVTNQDLGLSVHCQYDLSNRSVSHGVQLEINGEVDAAGTQSATVSSPNVTMMITDRSGNDITAAQVGDALALRFEIIDPNSPYEIFVRELVAMDGIDNSEILLIDSLGKIPLLQRSCPTDASIMGSLSKASNSGKTLLAPFEAFKFPTSDIVQFKALVTPCLPNCEPRNTACRYISIRRNYVFGMNVIKLCLSFGCGFSKEQKEVIQPWLGKYSISGSWSLEEAFKDLVLVVSKLVSLKALSSSLAQKPHGLFQGRRLQRENPRPDPRLLVHGTQEAKRHRPLRRQPLWLEQGGRQGRRGGGADDPNHRQVRIREARQAGPQERNGGHQRTEEREHLREPGGSDRGLFHVPGGPTSAHPGMGHPVAEEEEEQAGRRLHHPQHSLLRVPVLHERKTLIPHPWTPFSNKISRTEYWLKRAWHT
ncbi:uncharacterized protein CEXT_557511 [Caerostris extrusa]|uniref:Apple domain-containing protein n=2 Tax=Caerostris TaxID=172845 RepID=A0AAV4R735_CAEEX|nr:uncharacterized protein CEXT_557511 [Caerostris extrusa]